MHIKVISHLQSWVKSRGSNHKNSFDVLSVKQMKIENRIKEMLSIADASACYERDKENYNKQTNKLSILVCYAKDSKKEIKLEKRKVNKKLAEEMKCVVRKEKELNKLLDKQAKLNIKIGKTKEEKAKNAVKQLCDIMVNNRVFIKSEGIFRISPIQAYGNKYKNNIANLLSDIGENNVSDMNVVALAIKAQLKDSLTTSDHQIIASCIKRLNADNNIVFQLQDLPTSIVDVVKLCKKIIDEQANKPDIKMNAESLGIVLGPNIAPNMPKDNESFTYYEVYQKFFEKLLEQREIA
ncbi:MULTISPECIES: RhoGAP domain-containing protein [Vibrio]|uniref:RhoGAP domain-containing protein n=1 Tax=Vibrio TaxID=662 RepID=UPI00097E1CA5|nr:MULTISPECIES: RhoGAP domain-containing protein [Vibrio]AQM21017.1 hypothetical protein PN51_14480 [Vibrio anguillarum]AUB86033.1 hypothetical protein CKY00_01605 [Vibrio anguillarum]AUB89470.1 hypothetical protein CKX99_01600 [Vibrio anguillarum]AUB92911.1 hypothetical protein CK210_01600 [Vibrio anguillarum]AUB96344.1 hypothetical protein CK209_01600 [Vibrio anguillarum]